MNVSFRAHEEHGVIPWDLRTPLMEGPWRWWDDTGNHYPEPIQLPEKRIVDHFDYVVANHVFNEMAPGDVPRALQHIRATLRPGGALRLLVPDLMGAITAYMRFDGLWFPTPPEMTDIDTQFCTYVTWHGTQRSVYTAKLMEDLLWKAGFMAVERVRPTETTTRYDAITTLDSRPGESLIFEATK